MASSMFVACCVVCLTYPCQLAGLLRKFSNTCVSRMPDEGFRTRVGVGVLSKLWLRRGKPE